MNISKMLALTFFVFIATYAYSEDYMYDKEPLTTPYMKAESAKKSNPTVSKDTTDSEAETRVDTGKQTQVRKQIKAKSICIGEDCRSNWPSFKCANYDGRPAGETGDEFCSQMNQTCVAVSIGGGQTFFDECSVAASSVHRCRCCWVE